MIDPRGMSVVQWTDAASVTLASLGPIPALYEEEDWPLWAETVMTIPEIAIYSPPDPRRFNSWRDWAQRFVEAIPL